MTDRDLDVTLFGATGFVGRLTAEHLAAHAPAGARIGLAGRSERKLRDLQESLGEAARDWQVVVADVDRPDTVRRMAEQATVVATTVGPYARYGPPLVAACADVGTHYADLTGEVSFVRRVIDEQHQVAVRSGARIVNGAGFDAIPSDLGVLELHRAAVAAGAGGLLDTTMVVAELRGGVSGGTFASLSGLLADVRSDPQLRRLLLDPYGLSPDRSAEPDRTVADWPSERDPAGIHRDPASGRWLAPFVMSAYNTRIVRRSNALAGYPYGRQFRYREYLGLPGGPAGLAAAVGTTAGLGALASGLMFGPTRSLISRFAPAPGEGPSEQVRSRGRFRLEFTADTETGRRLTGEFAGKGDPGYAGTAVMFGESALALALDGGDLPDAAGVLTPATGIGEVLTRRLRARGFTITAA